MNLYTVFLKDAQKTMFIVQAKDHDEVHRKMRLASSMHYTVGELIGTANKVGGVFRVSMAKLEETLTATV